MRNIRPSCKIPFLSYLKRLNTRHPLKLSPRQMKPRLSIKIEKEFNEELGHEEQTSIEREIAFIETDHL